MNRATEHWPASVAPDFGGLHGRYARVWTAFNAAPASRWGTSLLMCLGAVCGLIVAWIGGVV